MSELPMLKDVEKEILKGVDKDSPFRKGFERAVEEFEMLILAHAAAYQKEVRQIYDFSHQKEDPYKDEADRRRSQWEYEIAVAARDAVLKLLPKEARERK